MKRLISGLTALLITFLLGLLLTAFFYAKNTIQTDNVLVLQITPLGLCELAANSSTYRGKAVFIKASHISLLSSQRFVIVSECGPDTSTSASITFANGNQLHTRLLFQLSDLMSRRSDSFDVAADRVIIRGVFQERNSSSEDLEIVASDVEVKIAPRL